MTKKYQLNIEEKFHVARYLNANFDNVCPKCHNTGNKRELYIYQKKHAFDGVFEYYWNGICKECKTLTNKFVPIQVSCTYKNFNFDFTINSDGFRSDEFTSQHDKKHVLFVGCSNTFGMGMKLENVWSHRLYSKILENEPLSGYYNLGHIGSQITENISNIFLYCKKYAKPNVIFLLMPTVGRELSPDQDMEKHNSDEEIFMNFAYKKQRVIDSYMMLEEYCASNNIKLISKTWDHLSGMISTTDTLKGFPTFIPTDMEKFANLVADYCDKNKDDPLAMIAADGLHCGNGAMYAESEIFYNAYKESL